MADTKLDASAIQSEVGSANSALTMLEQKMKSVSDCIASANKAIADSFSALGKGIDSIASSFTNAAAGLNALAAALPAAAAGMMQMVKNLSGIFAYSGELIAFVLILGMLALMGEGLAAAGTGLLNIGLGLVAMTEGMAAIITLLPAFIDCLANITANVGGILLFVLLAASVLIMAIALQQLNEQLGTFVESMDKLSGLMSAGFVAAFCVFGAMLIAMSLFMKKAADGMDKVTNSMTKQAVKLAVLNPLLAVQAVLTNPIMGAITVGLATASGLLIGALFPAMATGGVVSKPTMALVGEGRYPEAVVPLGDSPQFASMKTDIANAVLQGLIAVQGMPSSSGGSTEVVLNLDGERFARAILPKMNKEAKRSGYALQTKGV